MTIEEAKAKGYSIEPASAFEIGLLHNGRGLRTWWVGDFGGKMPELDHPEIQKHIQWNEDAQL